MEFTDSQIEQIKAEIGNIFVQKYEALKNGSASTEIQASAVDADTLKLQLKGLRSAISVCRNPLPVRAKIKEIEAQIPESQARTPIAAARHFGKPQYDLHQQLVMTQAEVEGLELGDGQGEKLFTAKDRLRALKMQLGLI